MAVVISYDKDGILSVVDMRLAAPLVENRPAALFVAGWSVIDEVASKKQSWETVSASTGLITGSNKVSP